MANIEDLEIGNIIYECDYGHTIKSTVITKPKLDRDGSWVWKSKTDEGEIIDYLVSPDFPHYAPKLYNYNAYINFK